MTRGRFFTASLIVTLLLAGVASFVASSHPDGLEYVAEQTGFLETAEESATADSPFADYGTSGVENSRLSGGLAGLVGVALVLALTSAITLGVRRRGHKPADLPADTATVQD